MEDLSLDGYVNATCHETRQKQQNKTINETSVYFDDLKCSTHTLGRAHRSKYQVSGLINSTRCDIRCIQCLNAYTFALKI